MSQIASPPVQLFEWSLKDAIALLRTCTREALPVLATLLASQASSDSSSSSSSTSNLVKYGLPRATFPTSSAPSSIESWAMVVPIFDGGHTHMRLYIHDPQPLESEVHDDPTASGADFAGQLAAAIVKMAGPSVKIGSVPSRYANAIRGVVGGRDLEECSVFLAPKHWSVPGTDTDQSGPRRRGSGKFMNGLDMSEYEWDHGHEDDLEIIKTTCDVNRSMEYYRGRLNLTTVLRSRLQLSSTTTTYDGDEPELNSHQNINPNPKKPARPVSWAVTHPDGSLGSLYTIPEFRRKGLAHLVCARRLQEDANERQRQRRQDSSRGARDDDSAGDDDGVEDQLRGFCHVFVSNAGSRGLMRSMGWEEGWRVKWVYADSPISLREKGQGPKE